MMTRRDVMIGGLAASGAAAARPLGQVAPYGPAPLAGIKREGRGDDSGRPVPAPPPGYWPYRGRSGAGRPSTAASASGGWEKGWRMRAGVPFRALWAPEIHFIRGDHYICHCMSRAGLAILKSTTGRAEGPCVHAFSPDRPLRHGIDANVFRDRGGRWWQTMFGNDDWSLFREKPGAVRIDFDAGGRVIVAKDQAFALSPAEWRQREKRA